MRIWQNFVAFSCTLTWFNILSCISVKGFSTWNLVVLFMSLIYFQCFRISYKNIPFLSSKNILKPAIFSGKVDLITCFFLFEISKAFPKIFPNFHLFSSMLLLPKPLFFIFVISQATPVETYLCDWRLFFLCFFRPVFYKTK